MVHRGGPDLGEEDNIISLPEIQTSIDPQKDTDYSSWGKDPASINYIGFIAYFVKANNDLHERVKALESKLIEMQKEKYPYMCAFLVESV